MAASWPHSTDYHGAVQTPFASFADAELKGASVALNAQGMPQPCAGNFADVYQFQASDGRRSWAVKCFTRNTPHLAERYREISLHLGRAKSSLTVNFQYLEQGIRIGGDWYPVLKMDWVDGQTLRQFVQDKLDKPRLRESLLQAWLKVEPLLWKAQLVHGDLQHGNIMLIPGESAGKVSMRLIDYDGMWVPALSQQPPGEVGHPAYQHPERAKRNLYTADVDRFPNLVIACALKCLARPEGPELWQRYDDGESLLFKQADFESPGKSELLRELWERGDPELQAWVGHLAIASQAPLEATPQVTKLLIDGRMPFLASAAEAEARRLLGYSGSANRAETENEPQPDLGDLVGPVSLSKEVVELVEPELVFEKPVVKPAAVSVGSALRDLPESGTKPGALRQQIVELCKAPLSGPRRRAAALVLVAALISYFNRLPSIAAVASLYVGLAHLLGGIWSMSLAQIRLSPQVGGDVPRRGKIALGVGLGLTLPLSPLLGLTEWCYGAFVAVRSRFSVDSPAEQTQRQTRWASLRPGWWTLNLSTLYLAVGTALLPLGFSPLQRPSFASHTGGASAVPKDALVPPSVAKLTLQPLPFSTLKLPALEQGLRSFAVSADGARAVTLNHPGPVVQWDAGTAAQTISIGGWRVNLVPIPLESSDAQPGIGLRFAPDGRLVVVADPSVLTALQSNAPIPQSELRAPPALAVRGKWLLAARDSGSAIELWDLDQKVLVRRYRGPAHPLSDLAFSGPETFVAATFAGDVVRYNLATGLPAGRFKTGSPGAAVSRVTLAEQGRQALASGPDGKASVWDVATGTRVLELDAARGASLSADGSRICYSPDADHCMLADASSGEIFAHLAAGYSPGAVGGGIWGGLSQSAFASNGQRVVCAFSGARGPSNDDSTVLRVYEIGHVSASTGAPAEQPDGRIVDLWYDAAPRPATSASPAAAVAPLGAGPLKSGSTRIAASPAHRHWLTVDTQGLERINLETNESARVGLFGGEAGIPQMQLSPDGKRVAVARLVSPPAKITKVDIYDVALGTIVADIPAFEGVLAHPPAFSPAGSELVGVVGREAWIWNIPTGGLLQKIPLAAAEESFESHCVFWSQQNELLVITKDGLLRAVDTRTRQVVRESVLTVGQTAWASLSQDGRLALVCESVKPAGSGFPQQGIVNASVDQVIQLFETGHGTLQSTLHADSVLAITGQLAAEGRLALLGGEDGQLSVWDLGAKTSLAPPVTSSCRPQQIPVAEIAVADASALALARFTDGEVYAWSLTGKPLLPLAGRVPSAPAAPPETPAVGSLAQTVLTVQSPARLAVHSAAVTSVALSVNAGKAASIDDDGQMQVHETSNRALIARKETFTPKNPQLQVEFVAEDQKVLVFSPRYGLYMLNLSLSKSDLIDADRKAVEAKPKQSGKSSKSRSTRSKAKSDHAPTSTKLVMPADLKGMSFMASVNEHGGDVLLSDNSGSIVNYHVGTKRFKKLFADGPEIDRLRPNASRRPLVAMKVVRKANLLALFEYDEFLSDFDKIITLRLRHLKTGRDAKEVSLAGDGLPNTRSAMHLMAFGALVAVSSDAQIGVIAISADNRLADERALPYEFWSVDLNASTGNCRRFSLDAVPTTGAAGAPTEIADPPARAKSRSSSKTERIRSIAVSPDGRAALTAGEQSGMIRMWDLITGKQVAQLSGHTDTVNCVVFSGDGRSALSGGEDKTVRFWDLAGAIEPRNALPERAAPLPSNDAAESLDDEDEFSDVKKTVPLEPTSRERGRAGRKRSKSE